MAPGLLINLGHLTLPPAAARRGGRLHRRRGDAFAAFGHSAVPSSAGQAAMKRKRSVVSFSTWPQECPRPKSTRGGDKAGRLPRTRPCCPGATCRRSRLLTRAGFHNGKVTNIRDCDNWNTSLINGTKKLFTFLIIFNYENSSGRLVKGDAIIPWVTTRSFFRLYEHEGSCVRPPL